MFAVFLTDHEVADLVRLMRRELRIRTTFEPTRASSGSIEFAYERLVSQKRRTLAGAAVVQEIFGEQDHVAQAPKVLRQKKEASS